MRQQILPETETSGDKHGTSASSVECKHEALRNPKTGILIDGKVLTPEEYRESHLERLKNSSPEPNTLEELKNVFRE